MIKPRWYAFFASLATYFCLSFFPTTYFLIITGNGYFRGGVPSGTYEFRVQHEPNCDIGNVSIRQVVSTFSPSSNYVLVMRSEQQIPKSCTDLILKKLTVSTDGKSGSDVGQSVLSGGATGDVNRRTSESVYVTSEYITLKEETPLVYSYRQPSEMLKVILSIMVFFTVTMRLIK
jgi:hypothetical protein